jgi:hypothetical protein
MRETSRSIERIQRGVLNSTLFLITAFSLSCPVAQADAFNYSFGGQAEKYGINYSSVNSQVGSTTLTLTRHHRLGQESGIGSSTAQTTGVTVETTPTVNYTPTSNPALIQTSSASFEVPRFHLFSQQMLSTPQLRPTFTELPSLRQMMRGGMLSAGTSSSGSIFDQTSPESTLQIWHPHLSRGAGFNSDLTNPFLGL